MNPINTNPPTPEPDDHPGRKLGELILKVIGHTPETSELQADNPAARARAIANRAAMKAASTAGFLALPPGPLAWITLLPELGAVWKIQAQMVADIAGTYGKRLYLTQEQMIYCLFRHGAAMAVRDIVVRIGNRYLVKQANRRALQAAAKRIGLRISQQAAAKSLARWIPVAGALGVGGYAYYDTTQVAKTAIRMFESEIALENDA